VGGIPFFQNLGFLYTIYNTGSQDFGKTSKNIDSYQSDFAD